ncbi:hypothetical protein DSO57_1033438 [Entomophthora muscae]|uniref:Uncharacterized protein n=1 Tax=Entomophthora muscae TaxID=34485 RepID=A0ACC2UL48_9FUNG|nr:hypothetical protein DSO57_1033438 [Entomophthora muscae]
MEKAGRWLAGWLMGAWFADGLQVGRARMAGACAVAVYICSMVVGVCASAAGNSLVVAGFCVVVVCICLMASGACVLTSDSSLVVVGFCVVAADVCLVTAGVCVLVTQLQVQGIFLTLA